VRCNSTWGKDGSDVSATLDYETAKAMVVDRR
jgi:hypothetical protein